MASPPTPQRPAGSRSTPASASGLPEAAPAASAAPAPAAAAAAAAAASSYEETHVHSVYEAIAPHFSATRHKPWPLVADFIRDAAARHPGGLGLDIGCGNGKYLPCAAPTGSFLLGCDRSAALAGLARDQQQASSDVLLADSLSLPFRSRCADYAICIAVVHHLATRERRRDAIRQVLRCLRPGSDGGEALLYVWALEQGGSRRGWDVGGEQDMLVPWVMKEAKKKKKEKREEEGEEVKELEGEGGEGGEGGGGVGGEADGGDKTFQRYYHLYRKGELEEDVEAAGGEVVKGGYERDNWWVIARDRQVEQAPP